MDDRSEIRWKIEAYTAETMPLDRLAEYIKHLTDLLGEAKHFRLIAVETGSA